MAHPEDLSEVQEPICSVVLRKDDPELSSWFQALRRFHPDAMKFLWGSSFSEIEVREALNREDIFRFFTDSVLETAWETSFQDADRLWRKRRDRDLVVRDFSHRNRELETLTDVLEKTIVERTASLEDSTREESDKLSRERSLIRFMNEMSLQVSLEEILRVLRRELRRFHRLQNLILALRVPERGTEFLSFRGDQILRAESTMAQWNPSDETSLRQFFANQFGRPFSRALFYPLSPLGSEGVLCLEYSLMSEKEIADLEEVLQDRLRPLAMAVDRVYLEDRLRRDAGRWEKTFDAFRDPIAVVDGDLKVLRGNSAFSNTFFRRRCYEAFAGRTSPCEGCPVAEAPESSETLRGTVTVGRRVYRVSSWPVREPRAARISGRVNHYSDVTESQELSLRMLQNEKMGAIGALAGQIAHELNNPLTGIRSLAQALKAELPPTSSTEEKNLADDLGQIEQAARRCQKIIHHLLEYSRAGEGPAVSVTLDEIVEGTLPLLKTALRPYRQEIRLSSRPAKILADPHLIQQVVFNLLNNACQAMNNSGTLAVMTRKLEGRVELKIADTGPGILPEHKARLFEPFFTTKEEGQGTGLGLSTSKSIVEKFGGRLRYEDGNGGGAVFVVDFPIARAGVGT